MGHTKATMKMKKGGRVEYDAKGSNVMEEAHEKKHGGGVHHGKVDGHKGKHRVKKARGGGVGSDHHPFSSAYRGSMEAK
jgi:hypothetical protein